MIDKNLSDLVADQLPPGAVLDAVSVESSRKPLGFRIEATYTHPDGDPFPRIAELPALRTLGAMLASMLGVQDLSPSDEAEDWYPRDQY